METKNNSYSLNSLIKKLPLLPGVYLFKDRQNLVLYVGKAKNLKTRVKSYLQNYKTDWKTAAILAESTNIEHHVTKNELEAMLLEANLIRNHQPKFNVLLKFGQPFTYIVCLNSDIPKLCIVRNKKKKGTYFGPFIEKGYARKVYIFLMRTFRLNICNRKINEGCLYYHVDRCAGFCRKDFDKEGYLKRLDLAVVCLKKGHKKFLKHLEDELEKSNKNFTFEYSKEITEYSKAFINVFSAIEIGFDFQKKLRLLSEKDIWIVCNDTLYMFRERDGLLKRQCVFYQNLLSLLPNVILDYFLSHYRHFPAPAHILINFSFSERKLIETFLYEWSKKQIKTIIINPTEGHFLNLVQLAKIYVQQDQKRQTTTPKALKTFFKLEKELHIIDCFDISHNQGTYQVGSCVRFKDGQPDKNMFRRFHIKMVDQQDDYACLREIVKRRYQNHLDELPDLILIDGGKGQLSSVCNLFPNTECASIAKREEIVFSRRFPGGKKLNISTFSGQLLISLRDYTHHFAISFHRKIARLK